jgi:hypothetical protein
MRVAVYCKDCMARIELPPPAAEAAGQARCSSQHSSIAFSHSPSVCRAERVDQCSRCGSTAFYVQKDFDQRLGCAILALGAVLALLAAWKFGGIWLVPVLLALAAVDFVLARRVAPVVICYRCDTEYRDVPNPRAYKPYDPHVAERDAGARTVRAMNP